MWQDIAILIIGVFVLGYVVYKLYRLITRPKQQSMCDGCCGCSVKKKWEDDKLKKDPFPCNIKSPSK